MRMHRTGDHRRSDVSLCWLAGILVLMACGSDPIEVPKHGSLTVVTTTDGGAFDLDGFVVLIDGDSAGIVDVTDARTLSLPEGVHSVTLAGLAPNCFVANPDEASVGVASSAQVYLQAYLTDDSLIEDRSFGEWFYRWPSWSPDGSRIVFQLPGSIGLVRRAGVEDYPLVPGTSPVWSVDGRIAYVGSSGLESQDIKVIHTDGGRAVTVLATPPETAAQPRDWSPDGRLLLYTDVSVGAGTDIYLLDVERGTTVRVTGDGTSRVPVFWPTLD